MAKKILITGATGFAGRYLFEQLATDTADTLYGTFYSQDSIASLSESSAITLLQVDLTNKNDTEQLIQKVMPDMVYHLAAASTPAESFKDPGSTLTTNILGQVYLLDAIKKANLDTKVLIVSSSDIYGAASLDMLPLSENAPMLPNNPYAVSKITQDYLALQYFLAYNMRTVRVRPFNHIGPRQADRFVVAKFAKLIAEIEKGKHEPIIEVGNLETKRDFTDVRDIVIAYVLLMEKGKDGDVYNIGSGKSYRIGDILDRLLGFSSSTITIKENPELFRPSDISDFVCDYTKIKSELGWEPKIPLDESLKNTLDYWREIV